MPERSYGQADSRAMQMDKIAALASKPHAEAEKAIFKDRTASNYKFAGK